MAGKTRKKTKAKAASGRGGKKAGANRAKPRPGKPAAAPEELLDMAQAIALLKTTRATFYRWLRGGKIKGMKVGRQWRFRREDLDRFLSGQEPRIELRTDIRPLINELANRLRQVGGKCALAPTATPVQHAVRLMIVLAVKMRASDIHVEPYEDGAHLRYRVDGVLHPAGKFDLRLLPAVVEQLKRMAACDVHETKLPQDGRVAITKEDIGLDADLRLSFLPAYLGEAVTIRILRREVALIGLDQIDYWAKDREALLGGLDEPWGLIIVTGPTGSGKTTVLYSCLIHLLAPAVKIMSVEDPVEYLIAGTTQIQINPKIGLTFERAIRSVLRSDPDVIMMGEIRNREMLELCMQASLTGHLVLTTLHTEEAAAALKRMVDIGVAPFLVADCTKLISAQRLVRRLCPACCEGVSPPADALEKAERLALAGGLDFRNLEKSFRKGVGCRKCGRTGYKGRTLVAEMLEFGAEMGAALKAGAAVEELRQIAVRSGMTTMAADGIRRAAAGQTSLDEVFRVLAV
ncbi:MAG: ATPase, T2SS/T4P/T4SS family [Planctomycetota bacterium]|jgi:excisionase family DNA binding protein